MPQSACEYGFGTGERSEPVADVGKVCTRRRAPGWGPNLRFGACQRLLVTVIELALSAPLITSPPIVLSWIEMLATGWRPFWM